MSRGYEIFATREDLLDLLDSVESLRPIQYVQAGLFDSGEPVVTHSSRNIERLGIALYGDQNLEPMFLILDSGSSVNVRPVPQRRGGIKYAIDQRENPRSIGIKTGGEYGDEVLIAGQIGTVSRNKDSTSLIRLFGRLIRRDFENVRGNYLGKGAVLALDSGLRLTASIHSPRLCDLKRKEVE